jgi:hypothetical protein
VAVQFCSSDGIDIRPPDHAVDCSPSAQQEVQNFEAAFERGKNEVFALCQRGPPSRKRSGINGLLSPLANTHLAAINIATCGPLVNGLLVNDVWSVSITE